MYFLEFETNSTQFTGDDYRNGVFLSFRIPSLCSIPVFHIPSVRLYTVCCSLSFIRVLFCIWSQEMFTVEDPPAPPSDTILLSPLKCLYKTNVHIQERPQPGDSRPVLAPSQLTLSLDKTFVLFLGVYHTVPLTDHHEKLGTLEYKH